MTGPDKHPVYYYLTGEKQAGKPSPWIMLFAATLTFLPTLITLPNPMGKTLLLILYLAPALFGMVSVWNTMQYRQIDRQKLLELTILPNRTILDAYVAANRQQHPHLHSETPRHHAVRGNRQRI